MITIVGEEELNDGSVTYTMDVTPDLVELALRDVKEVTFDDLDFVPMGVKPHSEEARVAVFIGRALVSQAEKINAEAAMDKLAERNQKLGLYDDDDLHVWDLEDEERYLEWIGDDRGGFDMHEHESGALKHQADKNRLELIPPEAIEAMGRVFTYGATKYDDRNWEKGIPLMTHYASALRHLMSWAKGIDVDPESGHHHLDHAITNLAMMVTQVDRERLDLDNRSIDDE